MAETTVTKDAVYIDYINHKGVAKSTRHIIPKSVKFGSNEYHTEPQWLLDAYDLDKDADRTFAIKDIAHWRLTKERTDGVVWPPKTV